MPGINFQVLLFQNNLTCALNTFAVQIQIKKAAFKRAAFV